MPRRAVETVPRRKTKGGLCPEKPLIREGKAAHFPQQGFTDTHGRRSFHIRPDGQGSPYRPLSPGTGETGHRGTGGFRPYFPARGAVCSGPVYQNPSGYRTGLGGRAPFAGSGSPCSPTGNLGSAPPPLHSGKRGGPGGGNGGPGARCGTSEYPSPHLFQPHGRANHHFNGRQPER